MNYHNNVCATSTLRVSLLMDKIEQTKILYNKKYIAFFEKFLINQNVRGTAMVFQTIFNYRSLYSKSINFISHKNMPLIKLSFNIVFSGSQTLNHRNH